MLDIGAENTSHVVEAYEGEDDMEAFLHSHDLRMPIFPSIYGWEEGLLSFKYDVDGVVVELSRLEGVKAHIPFITLPPPGPKTIKPHFNMLKKHVDLRQCSSGTREALKHVHGCCLAQTAGGYFLNVSVVPRDMKAVNHAGFTEVVAPHIAAERIGHIRSGFVSALRELGRRDMARDSVQKNSLANPSKFNLLAQDQKFVLGLLDEVVQAVDDHPHVRFLLSLSMFGQKSPGTLDLGALVDVDNITCASVHVACTLLPTDSRLQVMWSRVGLENLVGERGTLYPCLGMSECSNFQSNLDGRTMDVSRPLMDVLMCGEEKRGTLTFFQVYTDSPHTHLSVAYKHPVSGVIATCDLLHHERTKAMYGRAVEYMEHMVDLEAKLLKPLSCRLEQVRVFGGGNCPVVVDPEALFGTQCLKDLLAMKAMLVPFVDLADGMCILAVVQEAVSYLNGVLKTAYTTSRGKGSFEHSWRAYQAEIALEELFYGHPLSLHDRQLTIVLGTSATMDKSLTKVRGFLGLEKWNAATPEVCCPPLANWTKEVCNVLRIKRIFCLCESLGAAASVVGEQLWLVLLGDLYREPLENIPVAELKAEQPPFFSKVVGANQSDKFMEMLVEKQAFPFPWTFDHAKRLVTQAGLDPLLCLQLGLQEMKLRWFPHIQLWEAKFLRASWDHKSVIELWSKDRGPQLVTRVAVVLSRVLQEMERRGLCYCRKLDRYREQGMPWLEKCMLRLPANLQSSEEKLKVLVFLSSVALLENNDFVDYKAMDILLRDLPLNMARMQELLLLSKYILPKGTPFKLWRLHETIPTRMPALAKAGSSLHPPPAKKPRVEEAEEDQEDVQLVQEVDQQANVTKGLVRFVPPAEKRKWSAEEMSLINLDPLFTLNDAYKAYLLECESKGLPARNLSAFRHKRIRLLSGC